MADESPIPKTFADIRALFAQRIPPGDPAVKLAAVLRKNNLNSAAAAVEQAVREQSGDAAK